MEECRFWKPEVAGSWPAVLTSSIDGTGIHGKFKICIFQVQILDRAPRRMVELAYTRDLKSRIYVCRLRVRIPLLRPVSISLMAECGIVAPAVSVRFRYAHPPAVGKWPNPPDCKSGAEFMASQVRIFARWTRAFGRQENATDCKSVWRNPAPGALPGKPSIRGDVIGSITDFDSVCSSSRLDREARNCGRVVYAGCFENS